MAIDTMPRRMRPSRRSQQLLGGREMWSKVKKSNVGGSAGGERPRKMGSFWGTMQPGAKVRPRTGKRKAKAKARYRAGAGHGTVLAVAKLGVMPKVLSNSLGTTSGRRSYLPLSLIDNDYKLPSTLPASRRRRDCPCFCPRHFYVGAMCKENTITWPS